VNQWIRDPAALETIFALGLLEGDEIILKKPTGAGFSDTLAGEVFKIKPVGNSDGDELSRSYPDACFRTVAEILRGQKYEGWVLTTNQIAAWRRP
jgi:hypothetical protein